MYSMYLEGLQEVNITENKALKLEYYITEDKSYDNYHQSLSAYGIKIINQIKEDETLYFEVETIKKISYSKEQIKKAIDILKRNRVTPIGAIEVIDEIITQITE
ncbi:hypothetical protein EDC19_2162 [Natranaerovirga hydrolytica]|uniref:Uncharacterized protein n=1 Tax=Natranaerovirga hydrolytica TaxID=680378 RepID=A0A4R1MJ22_9FIRM|nr:DUF6514 family protein [Natranaerovirga hydrolytica]TCK92427.1 hypothetical protein EDC19_2162 [Natranaerovirga hydrolytica]